MGDWRRELKILGSAVQSRPCPPFFSTACPLRNSSSIEIVPRIVPNSGTLWSMPARVRTESGDYISELGRTHMAAGTTVAWNSSAANLHLLR